MSTLPSVITVTLNPAIDQTLSVTDFSAGEVNRVESSESHAAGKGVNVAAVLADLGEKPIATGFLGHDNAAIFERLFVEKQIVDRFVRLPGETRTGIKIVDSRSGVTTDINFKGLSPTQDAIDSLAATLREDATQGRWCVLSGSVPAGLDSDIYAKLIETLRAGRTNVLLDTSGQALKDALNVGADVVKPNIVELAEIAGESIGSPAEVVRVARKLFLDRGVKLAVVSMGGDGAIFVDAERALVAKPPKVTVRSTVGAGDAMVAGLVYAQIKNLSLEQGARLATALGTYAVTRVGAGVERPSDYEQFIPAVNIVTLNWFN